jgi:hypothetical protein
LWKLSLGVSEPRVGSTAGGDIPASATIPVEKESQKQVATSNDTQADTTIYTEKEIRQLIDALNEQENKVHFYLSSSPSSGGPLGRGAGLVELNPNYPGKGQRKYIVSTHTVVGIELSSKGMHMLDTDDPKKVAKWIKERHNKY